ncbi:Retinoblastoma-related protein [Linum perenne]
MEDPKPSTAVSSDVKSNGGEDDAFEVRFRELCKSLLSLEEKTAVEAMKLFKETKHMMLSGVSAVGNGTPEEVERFWSAFVLYSVKRLFKNTGDMEQQQQSSHDNGLTLCQILRSAKLNFLDFFKELPQFVMKVGPILSNIYGSDWEKRLEAKELQANFVHLSTLSRHYKRAYQELFLMNDTNSDKEPADSSAISCASDYHRFGWMLFLSLRVHALSHVKDLVTCINGLISVLAILIMHLPVRLRKFSLKNEEWFAKRGNKGVQLLASLCHKYETSEDDLKKMMEKVNNLLVEVLKGKPQMASECRCESLLDIETEGLIYYEGLMEESSLGTSLNALQKDYDEALRVNGGDLDERVFINEDVSLLGSGSSSASTSSITGNKRKFDSVSSPTRTIRRPLSPHRSPAPHANGSLNTENSKIAPTPVSTAMTTAKWLRTVVSPLPPKPSPQLERFLASCDRDVTNEVARRAYIILEAIFPSSSLGERCVTGDLQTTNLMDNIWAEQRRLEALKLYYRVLEAMCIAEAQILHTTNLTSILTNERFHRCMLACSAELVLATHKTVTMLFPAVLERTGITAFDLGKVIESFVRHEESLPRELRRHLNSLEERLLESLVWEKGSSLYNSLTVARPALSAEITRLGLLAEPMPSLDAIAMHMNLSSVGLPPMPSVLKQEMMPTSQNGDMRSPKRPCTDYRSVLVERNSFTSPAKDRLLALKSKLPPAALQSAFSSPTCPIPGGGGETCAETGINIFFGKINKLAAVRINGMIERLQPSHQHIRENVYYLFQQVLSQRTSLFFNRHMDQILLCCLYGIAKRTGQDHVDIITFYNEVFIPVAKTQLVSIGSGGTITKANQSSEKLGQCPASPKVSTFPTLPDLSPKKVSAVHNVYVSPLRSSKMDALISHSSKSYYACVGESTHAYQSPSKDLTAINNRLNSNRKAKMSLAFDGADVGLVSDSVVASSLNLENGNCASPVKTEQQPDS